MRHLMFVISLIFVLSPAAHAFDGSITLEITDRLTDESQIDQQTKEAIATTRQEIERNRKEMAWQSTVEEDREWMAKAIERKEAYIAELLKDVPQETHTHEVTVTIQGSQTRLDFEDASLIFGPDRLTVANHAQKTSHHFALDVLGQKQDVVHSILPETVSEAIRQSIDISISKMIATDVEGTETIQGHEANKHILTADVTQFITFVAEDMAGLSPTQKVLLLDWRLAVKGGYAAILNIADLLPGAPLKTDYGVGSDRTVVKVTAIESGSVSKTAFDIPDDYQ